MEDTIHVIDLEVYAYHGVFEEEKIKGQNFYISLEAVLEFDLAGMTDELEDTVSYADLCQYTHKYVSEERFDLLEKLATELSIALLERFKALKAIKVRIKKPDAPIGLKLDYPMVVTGLKWQTAYIGVGSNMGDKESAIEQSLQMIRGLKGVRNICVAPIVRSEPWGGVADQVFLNTVIELETFLRPKQLLLRLQEIENKLGRTRDVHWGNRTMDLDILTFEQLTTSEAVLTIPHPYMLERLFVLEPLCALNPNLIHPLTRRRVHEHLKELRKNEEAIHD